MHLSIFDYMLKRMKVVLLVVDFGSKSLYFVCLGSSPRILVERACLFMNENMSKKVCVTIENAYLAFMSMVGHMGHTIIFHTVLTIANVYGYCCSAFRSTTIPESKHTS